MSMPKEEVLKRIERQKEIILDIEKLLSNLKKLAKPARTKNEYEAKVKRLDELFKEASDNDELLNKQNHKGYEYFSQNKVDELLKAYQKCGTYLLDKRKHFEDGNFDSESEDEKKRKEASRKESERKRVEDDRQKRDEEVRKQRKRAEEEERQRLEDEERERQRRDDEERERQQQENDSPESVEDSNSEDEEEREKDRRQEERKRDEEKKKKKEEEREKKRREEEERRDWNDSSSSNEDSAPSSHSRTKKKKENKLISQFIKSLQANTKGLMQEERGNSLRMPMIEIPVFNGDYRKFRAFSETFAEIIDKSRSSNIEKLNMLRMKLTGEALKTIDHLVLVGDNYPKAWKLLRERFTNERKLIDAEIRTLLDLHELAPRSSEAIRSMIDNMREAMANLEIYGMDPLQWDPLVVTILIQKLDRHTRDLFEDALENSRQLPTTSDIEKFLLRRAEK